MTDAPAPHRRAGALRFRRAFLLLLVASISVLFVLMIRPFVLSVFLAAIFAGMLYPLYRWLLRRLWQRRGLAAGATLLVLMLGAGLPLAAFLTLVATEAVQVSRSAEAWLQDQQGRLDELRGWVERIPGVAGILPDSEQLAEQLRAAAGRTGPFLMGTLSAATRGAVNFFLQIFVFLYSVFFFLVGGPALLRRILYYLPLTAAEEQQLLERFVSVTRATLKGSLLIGVIQGALAGLAFWVAGVPGPAFWGTVMVVLALIPAVGVALIWIPAVLYLFLAGKVLAAIGLLLWCALVVSTIDNLLRPRLVGRDAQMPDLLILLSTLGGLVLFGAVGFIVGPIVAAVFTTVWSLYGQAFREWLPRVPPARDPAASSAPEVAGKASSGGSGAGVVAEQ